MDATLLDQIRYLCRDRAAYEKLKAILVQQERVHQLGWEERYQKFVLRNNLDEGEPVEGEQTPNRSPEAPRYINENFLTNIVAREKALAQLADTIQRSPSLDLVLQLAVQVAQKLLQVDRVAIFCCSCDGRSEFVTDAIATGITSLADMPEKQLALSRHIFETTQSESSNQTIENIRSSSLSSHVVSVLEHIGISSYAANKIYAGQEVWGILVAFHSSIYHGWSDSDRTSLSLVAAQIGIAISLMNVRQQAQTLSNDLKELQTELNSLQLTVQDLVSSKQTEPPLNPVIEPLLLSQLMLEDRQDQNTEINVEINVEVNTEVTQESIEDIGKSITDYISVEDEQDILEELRHEILTVVEESIEDNSDPAIAIGDSLIITDCQEIIISHPPSVSSLAIEPSEEVSPVNAPINTPINAPINTQVNPADRPTNPWESIIELVAEEVIEETLTETNLEITPEANLEVTNTNIEAIVEVIEENTKENLEPVSTNQSDLISNPVDANAIKAIDDANSTDIRNSEPIFSDSQTCEPLPTEALVDSVNATDSPVNLEDFSIEIPEKSQNIEDVEVLENLTEHTETTEVSDNPQAVTTDSLNEQLLEEKANSEIYIDQGFANSSSLVTSQNGLPHLFLASQPTEQQQDEVVEEALGEAISESTSQSISKATFLELTVDDEQDEEREPAIETQFIETILTIAGNGQKAYDFLIEVIDDYLDETPRLVQAIDKALAINDQVKLLQLINSLRTSSDYVGALTVSYQCRQLESAVRANYVVLIYASLSQVAIEVQRATDALRLERSRYVK